MYIRKAPERAGFSSGAERSWDPEAGSGSSSRLRAVHPGTSRPAAPGLARGHSLSAAAAQPPSPGLPTAAI